MDAIKPSLKKILKFVIGSKGLKEMHFRFLKALHFYKNKRFKKQHPHKAIPPDHWLYETFQLDYQKYFEDGELAAKEILNWTAEFLPIELPTILDWGCGTGRIIQHMHHHNPYLLLYGADINQEMIQWNQQNIKSVLFSSISIHTPTLYPSNYFDLIYGVSVFTHLPSKLQIEWIKEIDRICKPSGILLLTTMGTKFSDQLLSEEKNLLESNGILEKDEAVQEHLYAGDRNYSVYESPAFFNKIISNYFNVLQFYDGLSYPEKFGGQDLWILQKK